MVNGWLLYRREDYARNRQFADWFCQYGSEFGFSISLRFVEQLPVRIGAAGDLDFCGEAKPTFAINRSRDAVVAGYLEQAGCRVFNSAEVTRIGNDKWQTHLLAQKLGLPQAETLLLPNVPTVLAAQCLGWPVVAKHPGGHGGHQVALVNTQQQLIVAAASFGCERVLLQPLCGVPGEDLRVYVLGGQVLVAVRRRSDGGFRSNLSLGGTAKAEQPDAAVLDMVKTLCNALRPDYVGIDFIPIGDGRWFLNEIEDAVGSRSLYALGGYDVVRLYLGHIHESLNKGQ